MDKRTTPSTSSNTTNFSWESKRDPLKSVITDNTRIAAVDINKLDNLKTESEKSPKNEQFYGVPPDGVIKTETLCAYQKNAAKPANRKRAHESEYTILEQIKQSFENSKAGIGGVDIPEIQKEQDQFWNVRKPTGINVTKDDDRHRERLIRGYSKSCYLSSEHILSLVRRDRETEDETSSYNANIRRTDSVKCIKSNHETEKNNTDDIPQLLGSTKHEDEILKDLEGSVGKLRIDSKLQDNVSKCNLTRHIREDIGEISKEINLIKRKMFYARHCSINRYFSRLQDKKILLWERSNLKKELQELNETTSKHPN